MSSWLWQVLTFLIFDDFDNLRKIGWVFCRMPLNWSYVFLIIRLRVWIWRKEIRSKGPHHMSRVHTVNKMCQDYCWCWSPDWDSLLDFCTLKLLFPLLSIPNSLDGSLCKLFEIFLHERQPSFLPFLYIFYQYRLMEVYSIIHWVIVQDYLILLKLFHLWLARALLGSSYVPMTFFPFTF